MANPIVVQINAELENLQKELQQFRSTVEYLNSAKTQVKEAVISVNYAEAHFNKKVEELKNTYDGFIKLSEAITEILKKIDSIDFPERLDSIENSVKDTITSLNSTRTATLEELNKASKIITNADFDGRFKKLQTSVDTSVKSNEDLANSIERLKLPEKIGDFEKTIAKKIDNVFSEVEKNTKQIAADSAKSIHELNLPIRIDKLDTSISGILLSVQNLLGRLETLDRSLGEKIKLLSDNQDNKFAMLMQSIVETNENINKKFKNQRVNSYISWILILLGSAAIILTSKLL